MRIAHIILVHKNPVQLLHLVKRLKHEQADIYIHVDKKANIKEFQIELKLENVTFIKKRIECNWGGNSISVAIMHSISEITNTGVPYDFINLLSAQDLPVLSADQINSFLKKNIGKNFISYDKSKDTEWWSTAVARYEKYHFTDFKFKYKNTLAKLISRLLPKRDFPMNLEVYGGNKGTWWTITGSCAAYITTHYLNNKSLNHFLKYCWGTDELIIPTFVMNSPFCEAVVNDNLRYIDWSEGNASPKILTLNEYDDIVNSNKLYARKFDLDVDKEIFQKFDS